MKNEFDGIIGKDKTGEKFIYSDDYQTRMYIFRIAQSDNYSLDDMVQFAIESKNIPKNNSEWIELERIIKIIDGMYYLKSFMVKK